jgi:electron transport complex protein RnfB
MAEVYEKLREKIDQHPMRAPSHPAILAILKELFTPEEAGLAVAMSFKGEEPAEIAARANLPVPEAVALLENMADKGSIYCIKSKGKVRYTLIPPMPGFFEFPLMPGEDTERNRRLGALWEEYFTGALGPAMHDTSVPMSRVVPVQKDVTYGTEVFPHEAAAEIVRGARKIALAQCQCRFSVKRCDAPLDVCILLDSWADFLTDRGLARPIDVETALDALERAEKAGLVHMTSNTLTPVSYICNCCSCCCEQCVSRCPFDAVRMAEGAAQVDPEKCLGCGQCASVCPAEAIQMVKGIEKPGPFRSGPELLLEIAKDKGMVLP